jgi:hypothetical protein
MKEKELLNIEAHDGKISKKNCLKEPWRYIKNMEAE